uniref:Uncharacterized protein n=1 Tax=Aegilops tauschii subsp. strangulata TaxID=200361 RepID=A0A453LR04_AEGTS
GERGGIQPCFRRPQLTRTQRQEHCCCRCRCTNRSPSIQERNKRKAPRSGRRFVPQALSLLSGQSTGQQAIKSPSPPPSGLIDQTCSALLQERNGRGGSRGERRIAVPPPTHDAFRRGAVSSSGEGGDGLAAGWERLDLHWVAAAVADRGKSG